MRLMPRKGGLIWVCYAMLWPKLEGRVESLARGLSQSGPGAHPLVGGKAGQS
jgi:hypothetical protein